MFRGWLFFLQLWNLAMIQGMIDSALGVAKESIKTFSQEAFHNTIKFINGFSAMLLAVIPGKSAVLEGIHGWELNPTFQAARMPKWMESGVSSFNEFIHEYTVESDSDSESEYESGLEDESGPPSPSSQTSHLSRNSSFYSTRRQTRGSFLRRIIRFFVWPFQRDSTRRRPSHSRGGSSGSFTSFYSLASRRLNSMRDYVKQPQQRTDSPRRGVIEDLQLLVELSIEKIFDVMQSIVYHFFSPLETMKAVFRKLFFEEQVEDETTTVLGDEAEPTLQLPEARPKQRLNTDARTCEDIITELGYPYEAFRVTTQDGYILLLERIPRRDSQKVVYLQHGIFDSSLGWVSNGVVGSQAFAAYDQGYDVFLGNFRGLVSREHSEPNISSKRYWRYSVNEHGTQDVPAMLDKIHELKMKELQGTQVQSDSPASTTEELPYTICGISHSLGGAAMLMYVVVQRMVGRPHRLSRLVLLSPAGFHEDAPGLFKILQYVVPLLGPILRPLVPGIYVPTKFLRMLFNKLSRDFQNLPAVGGLVQIFCGSVVGGDSSDWVGALGCTHYNMDDMPGVAYMVAEHLAQMMRSKRFIMFDFGSVSENEEAYGKPEPVDIGANYGLIDIPVDLVAGKKDRLIPKSMVRKHYETMKDAGCQASYQEYEYAHLDFTFSHREELLTYVMSRLLLVMSPNGENNGSSNRKSHTGRNRSTKRLNAKSMKKNQEEVHVSEDGEVVIKENATVDQELLDGPMFAFPASAVASAISSQDDPKAQQQQQQVFASARDCLDGLTPEELDELSQN